MSKSERGTAFRVIAAVVMALVILLFGLSLFRQPKAPVDAVVAKPPFASMAVIAERNDSAVRDQALLSDPVPLFLPTEWNYEQSKLPKAIERRPEKMFESFEPNLRYSEGRLALNIPQETKMPASPVEFVTQNVRDPFLGLGRNDSATLASVSSREAFIEVTREGSSGLAIPRQALDEITLPKRGFWAPVQYLAVVKEDGLLGQLMLIKNLGQPGDNSDEIDAYLRDFLSKSFHLGQRLQPGVYRVTVGP